MATNFYAYKRISPEQQLELMLQTKKAETYDDLMTRIHKILDYEEDYSSQDSNYEIHLGRRSSHNFFVFARKLEDYIDIRNNLKENLKQFLGDNWIIMDEDGIQYEFNRFWMEAAKKIKPRYLTEYEEIINGHVFTTYKSYWS